MRVLHFVSSVDPVWGGVSEAIRQYCMAADRLGDEHEVVSFDQPRASFLQRFPAAVHALGPNFSHYRFAPRALPWLRANVGRYDAVIVHALWQYQGYAGWRACRARDVPYFVFPHSDLDPYYRRAFPLKHARKRLMWSWQGYRLVRDAQAVLFTCAEEARTAPETFQPYQATPAVVGLGIAPPDPRPTDQVDAFHSFCPAVRDRRFLLYLGRLHHKKGCDLLIDAFAQVAARDPEVDVVFAGPDESGLRGSLTARAAACGLERRVHWLPPVSGEAKFGAFRAAEAFVLPSHHENFGLAVVEALACGTPVLISDKVNIWREIVADGAGLAASDDIGGTIGLLEEWFGLSGTERSRMGRRALDSFVRRFGVNLALERLREVIASATGEVTVQ